MTDLLTVELHESVTATHCGQCNLRAGDWHLATECQEFGDGHLECDARGPLRDPACIANAKATAEVRELARKWLDHENRSHNGWLIAHKGDIDPGAAKSLEDESRAALNVLAKQRRRLGL